MPRRTILQHTLVAALAVSALAASPALGRPIDPAHPYDSRTSSLAGTASEPRQDLRGEGAKGAGPPAFQPGQPTWPINPEPVSKPAAPAPATDGGGDGSVWLVLGIGLAATGVAAGTAGVARRSRVRARRVAV